MLTITDIPPNQQWILSVLFWANNKRDVWVTHKTFWMPLQENSTPPTVWGNTVPARHGM
jgi:hypothetical protein